MSVSVAVAGRVYPVGPIHRTVLSVREPEPAGARFALDKIRRCLEAAGASFADVCKVTVFSRNIADREAVNRVRREYFGSTRPASTAVEVSRLVKDDLLVEIEVIAVRSSGA
jgi:2-iminobutanoate/2-iminopropanoate deaminase